MQATKATILELPPLCRRHRSAWQHSHTGLQHREGILVALLVFTWAVESNNPSVQIFGPQSNCLHMTNLSEGTYPGPVLRFREAWYASREECQATCSIEYMCRFLRRLHRSNLEV